MRCQTEEVSGKLQEGSDHAEVRLYPARKGGPPTCGGQARPLTAIGSGSSGLAVAKLSQPHGRLETTYRCSKLCA